MSSGGEWSRVESRLAAMVAEARSEERELLSEPEALELVGILGVAVPRFLRVAAPEELASWALDRLPGERVVVKAVVPDLLHKSEAGGVAFVPKDAKAVRDALEVMEAQIPGDLRGFLVLEEIDVSGRLGTELLFGIRSTPDFGPVVVIAPGGLDAERVADSLGIAVVSPSLPPGRGLVTMEKTPFGRLLVEPSRGRAAPLPPDRLALLLERARTAASRWFPEPLAELEINPLAVTGDGELVALDAVVRLARLIGLTTRPREAPPRPLSKVSCLLEPGSMAVVGVSKSRRNPGRIILQNTLAAGFPADRLHVIHPEGGTVEGCRCWPDLESLPEPVDLLVLATGAEAVPGLVRSTIESESAEAVIVIPGGIGEREGSEATEGELRHVIESSRDTLWGGPLVTGGNCLGVRSVSGRYDTLFIPRERLRFADGPPGSLAVVAQSGAFAVARGSRLERLNPRIVATVGNQVDMTVGDYLDVFADDLEIGVVGCYVEGLVPGDGLRILAAVDRLSERGVPVVVYRAGRTPAGAEATASHTASVAGDAEVFRQLLGAAGAIVAPTLECFDDLLSLFCRLESRPPGGRRLGAMSNAGFECVAIADALGDLELAPLSSPTRETLAALLAEAALDRIVGVKNPLDVTPMLGDRGFAAAARAILDDPTVDVALVGCVPLTPALETVPGSLASPRAGPFGSETAGVVRYLVELWDDTTVPWLVVVDGGPLYDPMVRLLADAGLPAFRTADRALAALGAFAAWHRDRQGSLRSR